VRLRSLLLLLLLLLLLFCGWPVRALSVCVSPLCCQCVWRSSWFEMQASLHQCACAG